MTKMLVEQDDVRLKPRFPNFFEWYKKSELCLRSTHSNISVFTWGKNPKSFQLRCQMQRKSCFSPDYVSGKSFPSWLFWCSLPFSPLLLFPFVCFPPFSLFHSFSLFLLTVKQEKDVLYRLGSTGPQLPNNNLIYQSPPASLHEETVLLCWLLLTARKAGCLYFWLHVLRMCLG